MRRSSLVILALASSLVALSIAATAEAQTPDCAQAPRYKLDAPETIAWLSDSAFGLVATKGRASGSLANVTATVTNVAGSEQHVVYANRPARKDNTWDIPGPRFDVASIMLAVSYDTSDFDGTAFRTCRQALTAVVRTVEGSKPRVRTIVGTRSAFFEIPLPDDCSIASSAPMTVEVRDRSGHKRTVVLNGQCGYWVSTKVIGTKKWDLVARNNGDRSPDVELRLRGSAQTAIDFDYRVTWTTTKATLIKTGRVSIVRLVSAARRIFRGSDDFVNVCINEHLTIRSYHHRLYCYVPKQTDITVRFRPHR